MLPDDDPAADRRDGQHRGGQQEPSAAPGTAQTVGQHVGRREDRHHGSADEQHLPGPDPRRDGSPRIGDTVGPVTEDEARGPHGPPETHDGEERGSPGGRTTTGDQQRDRAEGRDRGGPPRGDGPSGELAEGEPADRADSGGVRQAPASEEAARVAPECQQPRTGEHQGGCCQHDAAAAPTSVTHEHEAQGRPR
uniref:Uncharacterized protein n=1 Tax=Janibacter limosus TaxID=53458 RepID=A0AC61U1T8_9MICO|nr:hypothetical protein [Janibacter limosus]